MSLAKMQMMHGNMQLLSSRERQGYYGLCHPRLRLGLLLPEVLCKLADCIVLRVAAHTTVEAGAAPAGSGMGLGSGLGSGCGKSLSSLLDNDMGEEGEDMAEGFEASASSSRSSSSNTIRGTGFRSAGGGDGGGVGNGGGGGGGDGGEDGGGISDMSSGSSVSARERLGMLRLRRDQQWAARKAERRESLMDHAKALYEEAINR